MVPSTDVAAMHHPHPLKIECLEVSLAVLRQFEVSDKLVFRWLQGKLHYLEFGVEEEASPSKRLIMDHCSLVDPCHTLDINAAEDVHHT